MPVEDTRDADEIELSSRRAEAHHRAVVLEMVGDLPDAGECQLRGQDEQASGRQWDPAEKVKQHAGLAKYRRMPSAAVLGHTRSSSGMHACVLLQARMPGCITSLECPHAGSEAGACTSYQADEPRECMQNADTDSICVAVRPYPLCRRQAPFEHALHLQAQPSDQRGGPRDHLQPLWQRHFL